MDHYLRCHSIECAYLTSRIYRASPLFATPFVSTVTAIPRSACRNLCGVRGLAPAVCRPGLPGRAATLPTNLLRHYEWTAPIALFRLLRPLRQTADPPPHVRN